MDYIYYFFDFIIILFEEVEKQSKKELEHIESVLFLENI